MLLGAVLLVLACASARVFAADAVATAAEVPLWQRAAVVEALDATNCAGNSVDLTGLSSNDYPGNDASYTYQLHLCGVTLEPVCSGNGGSFCQYSQANPAVFSHVLAKWDSSAQWSYCTDATNCPTGGVQIAFANGDVCSVNQQPRQVTLQIGCSASSTRTQYSVTTQQSCNYVVALMHKVACTATPTPTPPPDDGGSGSKGLSGGSIFLIVLVVVIPLYIVVGCVWKRQRQGTSGMESCPNIDFWRDLPALVGDGFKFTWRKCLGLCGKGDAAYSTM